jgi:hypothetical protein
MSTPYRMITLLVAIMVGLAAAFALPLWILASGQAASPLPPPPVSLALTGAFPASDAPVMSPPAAPPGPAAADQTAAAAPQPFPLLDVGDASLNNSGNLASSLAAHPALPGALFIVVNTNDSGAGSLRDAVNQANVAPGHDRIEFNLPGCPCAIVLLSDLSVTGSEPLTVAGLGSNLLTLSGNFNNRIFSTSTAPLHISGLTLANGKPAAGSGGAVNSVALTLQNVIVSDSQAESGGGVAVNGPLVMTDTTFLRNTASMDGGGAYVNGTAVINGGSFVNNRTTQIKTYGGGGGLIAFNVTTITNTQFISNTTPAWGGGAYLANFTANTVNHLSGAIFNDNTSDWGGGGLFQWFSAIISSTTFTGNASGTNGGGAYAGYAGNYAITLNGGRIEGNSAAIGGGLYSDGSFTLQAVDVYSNTATAGRGGGAHSEANAWVSLSTFVHNTVITGGHGGGLSAQVNAAITDTLFLDNQVMGLQSGGGAAVGVSLAQPGSANLLRVTFTENSSQNSFAGGLLSYGPTRISDSAFTGNVSWNDGGGAWVGGQLTLIGGRFDSNRTLLNEGSGGGGGLFSWSRAEITGTRFISNTTADWGGGAYLYNPTPLTSLITNTLFMTNTASSGGGGGLFSWFTTTLAGPEFRANYASWRGGGLYGGYAGNYPQQVLGGRFSANSAAGGGGMFSDASIKLDGVAFSSNVSRSGNGGGVWTVQSARVTDAIFNGNKVLANGNSAGIDAASTLWLTDTLFTGNQNLCCSGGGSGSGGNTTVRGGVYRLNQALDDGGGLLAYGTASLDGTHFYTNTTGDMGGGMAANLITSTAAHFQGNTANYGGGAFAQQNFTLITNTFTQNEANFHGGGLMQTTSASVGQVTASTFSGNKAISGSGGGLYSSAGTLTLHNSLFETNTAGDQGGGIVAAQASSDLYTTFIENFAGSRGGGLMLTAGVNDLKKTYFLGNLAVAGGGLALQGTAGGSLENVLLARNKALGGSGQAVHVDSSSSLTILYTTISSPTLASGSAIYLNAGTVTMQNSILAGHNVGFVRIAGTATLQNPLFFGNTTNTQGAGITTSGAVTGDPAFFDPAADDYHLTIGSQAFNTGLALGPASDVDGDPRPQGGGYDIGYDEAITPSGVIIQSDAPKAAGVPVAFTGLVNIGQGVTFNWSFGDGHTSSGQTVTHAYDHPGVYLVTLTAANAAGQNIATANVTITGYTVFLPMITR